MDCFQSVSWKIKNRVYRITFEKKFWGMGGGWGQMVCQHWSVDWWTVCCLTSIWPICLTVYSFCVYLTLNSQWPFWSVDNLIVSWLKDWYVWLQWIGPLVISELFIKSVSLPKVDIFGSLKCFQNILKESALCKYITSFKNFKVSEVIHIVRLIYFKINLCWKRTLNSQC